MSFLKQTKEKAGESRRKHKMLNKKLGPELISYRPGFNGTQVAYIEGWTAISLANKIFGYDGWSTEIKNTTVDFVEEKNEKISMGISVFMRVTLKDGSFREDVGFGCSENQKSRAVAWEKARKESVTDAIKRALRQFGNALGNCCYDKEFLKQIKKVEKNKNLSKTNDLIRTNENEDESFSMLTEEFDLYDDMAK